jgi:hypothetical protein
VQLETIRKYCELFTSWSPLQPECYIRASAAFAYRKLREQVSYTVVLKDTMSSQVPAIYKEAIRRYEELTKKNLDDPALLKMTSVDDLMKEVDQQNNKFSGFRETRHLFFDALEGAMKPIELVGNLAAGAASMAFPPSSLVFGAAMYLINAAKGVSASYDAIQDLMGTLKVTYYTQNLQLCGRKLVWAVGWQRASANESCRTLQFVCAYTVGNSFRKS